MSSPVLVELQHVRSALRHLARHQSPARNPLAELACVRQAACRSGFDLSREAREFELGRLLEELVVAELERLRQQAGLAGTGAPRDLRRWPAGARIRADFEKEQPELEAWSALYHRYLRPDLNLSLQDLSALLPARCRRTIQRRLQRGLQALTERLGALERAIRRQEPVEPTAGARPDPWLPDAWALGQPLRALAEDGAASPRPVLRPVLPRPGAPQAPPSQAMGSARR